MTTEHSPSHCMKVGAIMAAVWAVLLACVLSEGWFNSIDLERPVHMLILGGTLAIFTIAMPAFRYAEMRNPASFFYLLAGAVLLGLAAALVGGVLFAVLLSSWNMGSHR